MARRCVLVALLVLAGPASAQPVNPTRLRGEAEAVRTRKRLTEAQQKLADGKPAEAADDLQKILDESGDDLVLVKDNNFQPARRLAHQYLASLPAAPLATFRSRLEEPARRLLDAGRTARDPRPLRELLDRYFVSRPAEDALLLLGELAFERGDFADAERHWRKLLSDDENDLRYPEPRTPAETVRAKLILARLFAGDRDRATADLEAFRKDHPTAAGPLAGTTGKYADTLVKLLAAPPRVPADAAGWSTFAGTPARDGNPDAPLPRYWPSRPTWRAAIPREKADKEWDRPKPGSFPGGKALAFHPVVLNGFAYLADAGRVFRFDLKTGAARLAFHYATLDDAPEFSDRHTPALAVPCLQDADFTLTAANGKLFARLGPVALPDGTDADAKLRTYLVALEPKADPNPPADELPLAIRWQVPPPTAGAPAVWEGAPAAAGGRVYAAFVRLENSRYVHAIACYPESGGRNPLWTADMCDTDANRGAAARPRGEVLSVTGATVVYASHTGVTVAVSAATGKPLWAFRNPPAARPPTTSSRDLCPPLAAAGKVFVAPADGDAVYALDAETGRAVWTSGPNPIQVEHLLGVSRGRLVVTVHAPNKGVRGYDVATGSTREPAGWEQHDARDLPTAGRGLAADNLILWPTQGILGTLAPGHFWLLDPASGRPAGLGVPGVPGNMAYADGVVLVATATELWGYVFDRTQEKLPPVPAPPAIRVTAAPSPYRAEEVVPRAKAGFDPVAAPSLAGPARVVREARLPSAAWPLTPVGKPSETLSALCDGRRLFAVELATGKTAWKATLEPPTALTHAAFAADGGVFAVGPHAAVSVGGDGEMRWEFRGPDGAPRPELSAAGFAGNRLVLRLGDRTLLALDTATGRAAWVRDALDRTEYRGATFPTAPRFGHHLAVTSAAVVVHRSDGVRVAFDPADGKPLREPRKSSLTEWPGPPAVASDSGRGAVSPTGPTAVEAAEATGEFGRWRFDAGREVSATGTPPQTRTFGDDCLIAVSRNYGTDLHLLNAKDGGARWRQPPLLPAADPDLSAADADGERVYLPTPTRLFALDRQTGKEAWAASLPPLPAGTGWRVRAGRRAVIAHPTAPVTEEDTGGVVGRIARRFLAAPTADRLPVALLGAFNAWARRTLPVLLFDPESGRLDQRIDVPTTGPVVRVSLHADAAVVTGVGKAVWLGK